MLHWGRVLLLVPNHCVRLLAGLPYVKAYTVAMQTAPPIQLPIVAVAAVDKQTCNGLAQTSDAPLATAYHAV